MNQAAKRSIVKKKAKKNTATPVPFLIQGPTPRVHLQGSPRRRKPHYTLQLRCQVIRYKMLLLLTRTKELHFLNTFLQTRRQGCLSASHSPCDHVPFSELLNYSNRCFSSLPRRFHEQGLKSLTRGCTQFRIASVVPILQNTHTVTKRFTKPCESGWLHDRPGRLTCVFNPYQRISSIHCDICVSDWLDLLVEINREGRRGDQSCSARKALHSKM
jgi:hypothetical protein